MWLRVIGGVGDFASLNEEEGGMLMCFSATSRICVNIYGTIPRRNRVAKGLSLTVTT